MGVIDMLNEFMIGIYGGQNQVAIDNFEYAMVMMEDYRNKYKEELRIPKGSRRNWFPLVLLHQYRKCEKDFDTAERAAMRRFFRKCADNEKYFSWYLDRYERQGNAIAVYYRANESMSKEIKTILQIYGLDFKEYPETSRNK